MSDSGITDLWQVEDAVWSLEDRQIAIEAAFTALLVTLHEAGTLQADPLQKHLQAATQQIEQGGEPLAGAAAALGGLTQFVADRLHPSGGFRGGTK